MKANLCRRLAVLVALAAPLATAQEALQLETQTVAELISRPAPTYPLKALMNAKEGWVMVSYVVSTTGAVVEPMIEDSSGVAEFESAALRAVERWRYTPAMQDGEPVEQAVTSMRLVFQLEDAPRGASRGFINNVRSIVALLDARNLEAAKPLIEELELGGRNNLYEDAWFWWLKYAYLEAVGSTDLEAKRTSLQRAVGYQDVYLAPDQFVAASERLVAAHVQSFNLSAAIATFERLRDATAAQRAESYEPAMARLTPAYERLKDIVAGNQGLKMQGKIGEHDYWVHDLLRRSFSLADVDGRLDVLDVRCERGTRRYASIPDGAVWTIPASWGECGVYVKGERGTVFSFTEYPASQAAAAPIDVSQSERSP